MATINANVFTAHTPVAASLLRNGPAGNVGRTSRASSIPAKFFYAGVRYANAYAGNAAGFITAVPTTVVIEAQVRSAFAVIVEAAVEDARTAHGAAAAAAAAAFDAPAARTTARADAVSRIEAIGIGAVHAALVVSYHIVDADLRPTERGDAIAALIAPAAAADAGAMAVVARGVTAGWNIGLESGHAAAALDPVETTIFDMAPMSAVEVELAYGLFVLGQVSPVRAGAQLFIDGHHYHSAANASSRHRAIERELVATLSTDTRNVWQANLMRLRNVVWHAGIHAVEEGVLLGLAEDADMPGRLAATGFGSFAVGLPAQEDLFQRAGSYIAVYNQVNQTATAHGHTLSLATLQATVTALSGLPRRGALPAARPALPGAPAAPWPAGCDTRAKALTLFLLPALNTAEPVVAWMFGFYQEITSRSGIRANTPEGSLLRSYSLKRAVANYVGEANRAHEMYAARAKFIRTEAEEGRLETYTGNA